MVGLVSNNIKPKPDCPNTQPPCNHLETVLSAISGIQSIQFCSLCLFLTLTHRQTTDFYFHMREPKSLFLLSVISPLETGQFEHLQEMTTEQCHFVTPVPFRDGKPEISSSGNSPWETIPFKGSCLQSLSPAVPSQSPFVNQTSKTRVPAVIFQILSAVTHS